MNPANQRPDENWEQRLDRELKRLPDRAAPGTLIPRVLAALQSRARLPWYRQPWWNWPSAAQVLSLLGLSGLLGLVAWSMTHAGQIEWTASVGATAKGWLSPLTPIWTLCTALVDALALLLRSGGGWILVGVATLSGVMYLSCVGLGTVFYRVAFHRRNL